LAAVDSTEVAVLSSAKYLAAKVPEIKELKV
jgi:hypothetical protein